MLHTEGKTVRTYCYTIDAVTALLTILAKGQAGEAYNVTNMDTAISIYDMAKLVSGILPESNIAVERDIPEDLASFGYNPEMIVKLDSTKLQELVRQGGILGAVDIRGVFRLDAVLPGPLRHGLDLPGGRRTKHPLRRLGIGRQHGGQQAQSQQSGNKFSLHVCRFLPIGL